MGRKKPDKSLIQQVKEKFDSMLAIGQSKYLAKINGTHTKYIFSWDTYRSYLKHACYFVKWVKTQELDKNLGHKPRTLEECRTFAERWIQHGIDRGLSAYTLKLQLSSLAKLYGCSTKDFDIRTPQRKRSEITRSRGNAVRDINFSFEGNKELITFCRCTGLRRAELAQIRGTDLIIHEGRLCLDIKHGTKGGRLRISPIVGTDEELEIVKNLCESVGGNKVFPKPNQNADIHSFRAEYAQRIYDSNKRNFNEFRNERLIICKNKIVDSYTTKNGRKNINKFKYLYKFENGRRRMLPGYRDVSAAYYCRNDRKNTAYDRRALFDASSALGHNRETIAAEHYLQ